MPERRSISFHRAERRKLRAICEHLRATGDPARPHTYSFSAAVRWAVREAVIPRPARREE